jgi:hypothetical protein
MVKVINDSSLELLENWIIFYHHGRGGARRRELMGFGANWHLLVVIVVTGKP